MSQEGRERSPEEEANLFADLVRDGGFWRSVDLRVCAFRSGRRWVNRVTRGYLDHRPPRSVPRFSPVQRRRFRVWQLVRPVADLPAIVRRERGLRTSMRIRHDVILLDPFEDRRRPVYAT